MKLKKILGLGIVAVSALVLSACNAYKTNTGPASGSSQNQTQPSAEAKDAVTITFTDSGFSPSTVTVKSGGKITWTNNSQSAIQVASNPHPTHTDNSELTNGGYTLAVAAGASVTVTVTKTGSWGYHNHLAPSVGGTVVVK